jgi:hypothetical protein
VAYRTVYRASIGVSLFQIVGALIMVPFGVLIAAGLVVGGLDLAERLREEVARDPWSLVRTVPLVLLTAAFGLFLAYALLRHGIGGLLDALGVQRSLEGVIEERRTARGSKGGMQRYIRVTGVEIKVQKEPFDRARDGLRVRVRFGRFERELTELAIDTGA